MKSILLFLCMSFLLGFAPSTVFAAEESLTPATKNSRAYPGGLDEEDLKVQESMRAPTTTVDRRAIETRILKNYLKKDEAKTTDASNSKKKSE